MSIALLVAIAGLVTVGLYLITARSLSRIVLGFSLLGHASVLALVVAGGPPGQAPIANRTTPQASANPMPQALSLTAIVISFGLTLFLLALARRQQELTGDDLVEDDLIGELEDDPAGDRTPTGSGARDDNRSNAEPGETDNGEVSQPVAADEGGS